MSKIKFYLDTRSPIAKRSYDYLYPEGAIQDNSRRSKFNDKLRDYPGCVLDLGCAGGGFVKDCVDEGRVAIGLEGTDYNKREGRFEWATIPDNLFTCDLTQPFTLHVGDKTPFKFNIITAWEFFEHIEKKDLPQLFTNIRNHMTAGGLVFASIDAHPYPHKKYKGVDLHRTVEERGWWSEQFSSYGFVEEPDIRGHFVGRFLREGKPHDPLHYTFVFRKYG